MSIYVKANDADIRNRKPIQSGNGYGKPETQLWPSSAQQRFS